LRRAGSARSHTALQHGPVELVPATIADGLGSVVPPYRSVDPVALLLRRGAITPSMAAAASSPEIMLGAPGFSGGNGAINSLAGIITQAVQATSN
jgi:hypothetical protein